MIFTACKRIFTNLKCLLYFYAFRVFPIQKNKIVFYRHYGKGFGCHGKYIALKLIENDVPCELVWIVSNMDEQFPEKIRKVRNKDFFRIYELVTAGIWIDNDVKHRGVRKRKGQYYINTWHGVGVSLKKFYLDAPGSISKLTVKNVKQDAKLADVYLAGSEFIKNIYKSAFQYTGKTAIVGSPRVDILLQEDASAIKGIKKKLGLNECTSILLYAPTFRKGKDSKMFSDAVEDFQIDFNNVLSALQAKYGGQWHILIRLHPRIEQYSRLLCTTNHVADVSAYPDLQELMLAADILITDYSSIMFEFAYTKKPVFLFAQDLEKYCRQEREFYFDINLLPFAFAKNESALIENIKHFDKKKYLCGLTGFFEPFGIFEDGKASQRVADMIKEHLDYEP